MRDLSRRDAFKLAISSGVAMAMSGAMASVVRAAETASDQKKVRIGFIGVGSRGTGLLNVTLQFPNVEVPAVCDIDPAALKGAQDKVEKARGKRPEGYSKDAHDYRRLLARDDLDAVLIASPQELHAEMVIDSFNAKKFVGSEVPACITLDECWKLVKAHEETKTGYMMLEKYLYSQPVMMVQQMVEAGLFGELTYGYGTYIHEIRNMRFKKDGSLTWRGENILHNRGIIYPTHAIGPVCRWMGINKTDSLSTLVAMDSKAISTKHYAAEKFGPDSDAAKVDFENGDTNQCLVRTKNGRLIEVRYDTSSPRPPGMGEYSLQGSKGCYLACYGERKVYIEGQSKGEKWQELDEYKDKYNHPYWAKSGEQAGKTSHGGGDYFVISDFIQSIITGNSAVDIYDAVTWSCIRPL
ncbi:MAG TPA: Gfo/Idh/MocA family oxidoreductase, partial [Tepidisphaeraceae bacterium]|nr:Gfo/Idh/MocA family oxidoreductase [Tepidisphaeraceae bacterium]